MLFDLVVDGGKFFRDLFLLGFQKFQWDGIAVVRFEEFLAFVLQRAFLSEQSVYLQIVSLLLFGDDVLQLFFYGSPDLWRQLYVLVKALNFPFHLSNEDVS